jgi:acyl-CoA-binding protein
VLGVHAQPGGINLAHAFARQAQAARHGIFNSLSGLVLLVFGAESGNHGVSIAGVLHSAQAPVLGGQAYFAATGHRKIQGKHSPAQGRQLFPTLDRSTPMSNLQAQFEAAVANSKSLTERPDNSTLLKIYGLYKQATVGDNADKKPGFSDMVGRAKWEAWNGFKGTAGNEAMQQYVDLIESLS